mgnify:CR=1 FL=1
MLELIFMKSLLELNEKLAMKYLKLAIEKHNHSQALYELGTCYYTGIEG